MRLHILIVAAVLALTACSKPPLLANSTPVEVWRGGDDGLTARFADALEAAFRQAPEFSPNIGKIPGTLIVTIPTNLIWRRVANRTEVTYSVEFTDVTSQSLGTSRGICMEDQLQNCAARVLKDAKALRMELAGDPGDRAGDPVPGR